MRIISGRLAGRRLQAADGAGMRPAMGKTREALFSILEARAFPWENSLILDLFAGSGSLGFECLSRGAKQAVFVENGERQCRCLYKNAENLGVTAQTVIRRQNVVRFLKQTAATPYNLVFLDPPYGQNLATPALLALVEKNWLAPGAIIAAEFEKKADFKIPEALGEPDTRIFGQTALNIWTLP